MHSASFSSGISSGSCGDVSATESPQWLRSTPHKPGTWVSPQSMNTSAESSPWLKTTNMTGRLHSTPFNQRQARRSCDEDEFALPPIHLLKLDRSPMEILLKKAHSGSYPGLVQPSASPRLKTSWPNGASGQGKPKLTNAVDDEMADFLEWEIRLRLFYIQQLASLKQEGQKEKLEEMKRHYINLDYQLQVARADLACAFEQRSQLERRLRVLEQDKRHLTAIIQSNDQAALVQLTSMQEQLKDSETRLEKLAKQVGLQPPSSAFTRVFLPPSPPEAFDLPDLSRPPPNIQSFPAEKGTRTFTTLIELAGQLAELCKGEFGSKLVVERLVKGHEEESRLLWKEIGLPATFPSLVASPTSSKVVFALMETWPWARQALQLEMAKLVPGNIEVSSKFEESHKMEEQAFQDVEGST